MKPIVIAVAASSMVLVACSASTESSSDPTASNEEALSCAAPNPLERHNPWWKTQYDGSKCEDENCGLAAIAMLRSALTCGASDHTGGYMRARLNDVMNTSGCPGTNPSEWRVLLDANEHGRWLDGSEKLDVVEHYADGFTIDDLAAKMSHGWVAIMAGNANNGQPAPCDFHTDHALFIGSWDGEHFGVYDPDSHNDPGKEIANCGSTRVGHATALWTKEELRLWGSGLFTTRYHEDRHDLWVVIARRPETITKVTSGECTPGATRTCVSPDCCGICGHATQTCSSEHQWVTGTCHNGC